MASANEKKQEERLEALEMRTNALSDAMIVPGFLEGRIERNLAELGDKVNDIAADLRDLTRVVQVLAEHQSSMQARLETLTDNQANLQAALHGLIEQVDRFIRGQHGNGHGAP